MLSNPNLFIVSGGPGTGKTTLIAELSRLGFRHAPEVARQIIQEQVESRGHAVPWGNREAYTSLMLERSIESFRKHTPAVQPLFGDRGIPDTLCYARLIGLADTAPIERACREYRYARWSSWQPRGRRFTAPTGNGSRISQRRCERTGSCLTSTKITDTAR